MTAVSLPADDRNLKVAVISPESSQRRVPVVPGIIDASQSRATAAAIAAMQEADGSIPWFPGGHVDPWDHIESAMGLSVGGEWERAEAGYDWLRKNQRQDGSWAIKYRNGAIEDSGNDSNFCAYVAVGVWHHFLVSNDTDFLDQMWPVVDRALNFVLSFQGEGGQMFWASGPEGYLEEALVTGSSSIHHSLWCGVEIANHLGHDRPEWAVSAERLGTALRTAPRLFTAKDEYSMDWYYPILCGAMVGDQARDRLAHRWSDFVVPDLGLRCVDFRPWVTGAETCELVMALDAVGMGEKALSLFSDVQHLRDPSGVYWTGLVFTDGKRWPVEVSSWTSAAVLLAADALSHSTPGSGIFRSISSSTCERLEQSGSCNKEN